MAKHEDRRSRYNRYLTRLWLLFPGIRSSVFITQEKEWLFPQTGRGNGSGNGRPAAEGGTRGESIYAFVSFHGRFPIQLNTTLYLLLIIVMDIQSSYSD
jgi:hypothetical protein